MGTPCILDRQSACAWRCARSPPQTLGTHRLPPGAGATCPQPPGALGAGVGVGVERDGQQPVPQGPAEATAGRGASGEA